MSAARAAEILRAGGLVVFPTETVYGVGADAANPHAVARIFAAKGRPQFNPLISHVLGIADAERHATLHPVARALAEKFWPGPLTIVVPRREDSPVAELACAGLATIALRAPAHPLARDLLTAFDGPVVAPSANRSGHVSATTAAHAAADLERQVDLILDGGPAAVGLESTIVAIDADGRATLLRPGAIGRDAIEAITGALATPSSGAITAPGMMESHYAPRARIILDAAAAPEGAAYLAFGAPAPPGGLSLSVSGDLTEAAANLYAHLRALDAAGADTIAIAPIPGDGLAEAIRDRLARAAAPR
ncbi:MAG: threonylcarbamoyl-AMP synthase [Hyphomonadaceae bacterium]|nr:threonylcarbamoyl-AMP synthase [Hyphomonadaceae bacterium]